MQQEKQNKHWAESVDALQELPEGFYFDSRKVWTGLEQQLPAPARKNRFVYYAAASVAIIIAGTCFFFQERQVEPSALVGTPLVVKPVESSVKTKKYQPFVAQQPVNQQKNPVSVKKQTKTAVIKNENLAVTIPVAANGPEPEIKLLPGLNPLSLEKQETAKRNIVIGTAKPTKKLKIIHLNELGIEPKIEPWTKQELKQIAQQQQQTEVEESAPAKDNLKQILYFKTLQQRTNTSTTITNNP